MIENKSCIKFRAESTIGNLTRNLNKESEDCVRSLLYNWNPSGEITKEAVLIVRIHMQRVINGLLVDGLNKLREEVKKIL